MRLIWFLSLLSALILLVCGCGEDTERQNPLDAQNEETGGVTPGILARAGDGQVALSWANLGIEGIEEYKIYRSHRTSAPGEFQLVASVPARPRGEIEEYTYTDTGLQNDGDNLYFYRVSYVDRAGNETPDPVNPRNLPQDWFLAKLIPSVAPPVPDVRVVEDTDLQVRLLWTGYGRIAPADLVGYRIYSAQKVESGEQPPLELVVQIDTPDVEFYIDGNDYVNKIVNFTQDGVTKLYRVVAFDRFGVESDSPILEGTSPNLPPKSPQGVQKEYNTAFNLGAGWGLDWYEVTITWEQCVEPDVMGYAVYAISSDPFDPFFVSEPEFKKLVKGRNVTQVTLSDRYMGFYDVKDYYITAYDSTPKFDGRRDESIQPSGQIVGPISVGQVAPDFTLTGLDGGSVSLHDFVGKVVLIDFWATWCGPCEAEVPHLQDLYEKYETDGLVILGVDLMEPRELVRQFRDRHGLTYDILLDMDGSVATLYGVLALPTVWIVDRNGIITWGTVGFAPGGEVMLEQQILAALQ